jgi:hypothetical protein
MLENWGQMTKAQDDSTTIDQAIASAILAHEADSESHMGEGESIENHRINDIIDHPQGSVVADKVSTGQIIVTTNFESSAGWDVSAYSSFFIFPALILQTSNVLNNVATAYLTEVLGFETKDFDKDLMFQFTIRTVGGNSGDYNFIFSVADDVENTKSLGFKIVNGVLSGLYNPFETLQTLELLTLTMGNTYTLRCFINSATSNVEFWVNGVLVGSLAYTSLYNTTELMGFRFHAKKVRGTTSCGIQCNSLTFARNI